MRIELSRHSYLVDVAPLDGAPVPGRIHLLPASGFTGRDGRGPYFYKSEIVQEAFAAYGMPLPIDYEHQSLDAAYKTGATPAAGWIVGLEFDDQGVWGLVEWTEAATAYIAAREYRFLSPVFEHLPGSTNVLQLVGAGLTNNPNLYLTSLNRKNAASSACTPETPSKSSTGVSAHMRETLIKLLGLEPEATDETITAAVTAATEAAAHAKAAAEAVGAENTADIATAAQSKYGVDLSTFVAKADFEAMSKRATDAETALAAHNKDAAKNELEAFIQTASAAGKLRPSQVAHAREIGEASFDALKSFVENLPVQLENATLGDPAGGDIALTPEQQAMCRLSGLTEDAFRASLKTQRSV